MSAERAPAALRWGLGLLLVAGVAAIYAGVHAFPFVNFDDDRYVTANPAVLGGWSAESARWAWETTWASNWHPLTWWSHLIDVTVFGVDPGAMHLVNVAWHALAALFLFAFLERATRAAGPAFLVAAFFAWHPLRVESVAWISERKDVLSGALGMAALWLYAGYARAPSAWRYGAFVVAFLLGLLAKPMLVTLPFLLLLLDRWPLARSEGARRLVLEKLPLFAAAALVSLRTWSAQSASGATEMLGDLPLDVRLANAFAGLAAYARQTLWPSGLACLYPHAAVASEAPLRELLPRAFAGGALVLVAAVLAWRLRRRAPAVGVGLLWTLGLLVPVCGLKQVGLQGHADRYTYLPLIGLAIAVVYGGWPLVRGRLPRSGGGGRWAVAGLVLLGYGLAAHRQVDVWSSPTRLWETCLEHTRGNPTAHNNLGRLMTEVGRWEEAEAHFRAALTIRPGTPPDPEAARIARNLAGVQLVHDRFEPYVAAMERAIELDPENLEQRLELVGVLDRRYQDALLLHHLRAARRLAPARRDLRRLEAEILAGAMEPRLRDGARAEELARALCEETGFAKPTLLATLAAALARQGNYSEALRWQERALERSGPRMRDDMAARLELYRAGKPWRRRP